MHAKFLIAITLAVLSVAVVCRPVDHFYQVGAGLPTFDEMHSFYQGWLAAHKNWRTHDTSERFEVFSGRLLNIIRHNQNPHRTYDQAVNHFTGKLPGEIRNQTLMSPQDCSLNAEPIKNSTGKAGTSDFLDWRDRHKITEVKIQRDCAGSWAFAATCAVESHWAIRTDVTPVFSSEQQLMDCSNSYKNEGCSGGLPQQGFAYLEHNQGLSTENTYPFEANTGPCRLTAQNVYAKVFNGSVNITAGDENAVFDVVNKYGPLAIAFDVTEDLFAYDGGVFTSTNCKNNSRIVNHAAAVVGYGFDEAKNLDYWIVKNSWGLNWGEEGYFRIARGNNTCGVANCASYPNMNYTSPITSSGKH